VAREGSTTNPVCISWTGPGTYGRLRQTEKSSSADSNTEPSPGGKTGSYPIIIHALHIYLYSAFYIRLLHKHTLTKKMWTHERSIALKKQQKRRKRESSWFLHFHHS
jgi:hypothetical protein